MYNRSNGIASYGKIANFETDPLKQIVMLYDGAIKFLYQSAADIEAADFAAKAEHSNRALDIVNYLQGVLDLDNSGRVGQSLDDLYSRVRIMILKASTRPDAALMRSAADALRPVREAWEANSNQKQIAAADVHASSSHDAAYARLA
ncbi:MAG: flagellar export chaperone FliS [Acidobacteria bacterium]|nr:flagellar export chaperone FliS [Acidobacteriota bacterium]